MRLPLGKLFSFVLVISKRHNIDESHSLGHSMRVFQFAEKIAREEKKVMLFPDNLVEHRPIIQAAAILHDTCDKKYRNEEEGLKDIEKLLELMMFPQQIHATIEIIRYMSYSKVKKNGMPDLGGYQTAYNIVREADLLDAYDFDRSMIYHMQRNNHSIDAAYENAHELFENRVLRHEADGLLLTQYAKNQHAKLSQKSMRRMQSWQRVLSVKK